jgi:hypothetical protein
VFFITKKTLLTKPFGIYASITIFFIQTVYFCPKFQKLHSDLTIMPPISTYNKQRFQGEGIQSEASVRQAGEEAPRRVEEVGGEDEGRSRHGERQREDDPHADAGAVAHVERLQRADEAADDVGVVVRVVPVPLRLLPASLRRAQLVDPLSEHGHALVHQPPAPVVPVVAAGRGAGPLPLHRRCQGPRRALARPGGGHATSGDGGGLAARELHSVSGSTQEQRTGSERNAYVWRGHPIRGRFYIDNLTRTRSAKWRTGPRADNNGINIVFD